MYELKNLDFGFVVLCPERNVPGLRSTVRSIGKYYDVPNLCIAPKRTSKSEMDEMKGICETIKSGDTYTSLINKGLAKSRANWNFFIFAGSTIRPYFYRKFVVFHDNDKDIMFPIVDRKTNFVDGSMNGIFMHKRVLKDIGKMDEKMDDLPKAKLIWAHRAVKCGYKFKAILGARVI